MLQEIRIKITAYNKLLKAIQALSLSEAGNKVHAPVYQCCQHKDIWLFCYFP